MEKKSNFAINIVAYVYDSFFLLENSKEKKKRTRKKWIFGNQFFYRNETILVHCAKGINCTHNLQKNATRCWSSTTLTFILAKMLIEEVLTASITAIYVNEKMHRDRRDSCTSSLIQIGNVHNAHKTQADVRCFSHTCSEWLRITWRSSVVVSTILWFCIAF